MAGTIPPGGKGGEGATCTLILDEYTEDLQHGQVIRGLAITDPFR
jgi:predicted nucleic acid-binding protein